MLVIRILPVSKVCSRLAHFWNR